MEAAVPAFVAALLTQIGDRSPWLVAILADRYGRPLTIALAALFAHAAGIALAAAAGMLIAPLLTPNAKMLLLALALIFAAMGSLWRLKPPDRLDSWRIGALLTGFLGVFSLALGDTTQFFVLAFSARGSTPWLAGAGALVAVFAVNTAAALSGEMAWRQLPIRAIRILFGLACLAAGLFFGAQALRLA
ncbi:MAG: TMEM165/GDT1 family protein [Sphingomonas sp.]|nr:TMEM165/GDT1 family protein [Sphingomonas sp.]